MGFYIVGHRPATSFPDLTSHALDDARYLIINLLGIGSYDKVYRAIDTQNDEFLAIKCLEKPEPSTVAELNQTHEFEFHKKVGDPPNVITTDYGTYCHRKKVYRRDIKLENILFDHDGHVYIADFELCTDSRVSLNFGCGTVFYMSPESSYLIGANDIICGLFELDPHARTPLTILRDQIVDLKTFFKMDKEIALMHPYIPSTSKQCIMLDSFIGASTSSYGTLLSRKHSTSNDSNDHTVRLAASSPFYADSESSEESDSSSSSDDSSSSARSSSPVDTIKCFNHLPKPKRKNSFQRAVTCLR
ncbi:kinase-like domain-containing protein [Mycena floridula]|nr:kinase-like domain-containing protein [Mycena floridula]